MAKATNTAATNGDGLSAAVEASLHDMGMDIEKLIDEVTRLSVNDDPIVVQDRAKLKQFQSKGDTLAISRTWSKNARNWCCGSMRGYERGWLQTRHIRMISEKIDKAKMKSLLGGTLSAAQLTDCAKREK